MSRFMASDGCRLAFDAEGPAEARPVLLLHSLGCDHRLWDAQAQALVAGGRRVIRPDIRGHGGSDAPSGDYPLDRLVQDALELLDHVEAPRAHVVGLSLGGVIAQALDHAAPPSRRFPHTSQYAAEDRRCGRLDGPRRTGSRPGPRGDRRPGDGAVLLARFLRVRPGRRGRGPYDTACHQPGGLRGLLRRPSRRRSGAHAPRPADAHRRRHARRLHDRGSHGGIRRHAARLVLCRAGRRPPFEPRAAGPLQCRPAEPSGGA
ncbi:alpha/beta fold hydrolase [Phenylobacterium sp. J426]|uniref:alpha/beta fold hydrolase n=1 Tax=Phenylobacterium sp. J426 TaxID=2898439 RepID=UPI0035B2A370